MTSVRTNLGDILIRAYEYNVGAGEFVTLEFPRSNIFYKGIAPITGTATGSIYDLSVYKFSREYYNFKLNNLKSPRKALNREGQSPMTWRSVVGEHIDDRNRTFPSVLRWQQRPEIIDKPSISI